MIVLVNRIPTIQLRSYASEVGNWRRVWRCQRVFRIGISKKNRNNTMTKRKSTKGQTTKEIISIFPSWPFHSYVATFQQHLHMVYISLSWYDILELVGSIRISLIEGCCEPGSAYDNGTYSWSFVTQIFHNGQSSHGGDHTIFEVMISTQLRGTLCPVAFLS
jgi:hypothetical protein